MKRKTKVILIGLVAVIYVIIAVNFNKIKYTFNMVNLYNEDRKTEDPNNETDLVLENPLESIIANMDDDKNDDENIEAEDSIDEDLEEASINDNTNPSKDSNTTEATKSYTSIVNDYNNKLENLQAQFEGDLNNLMSQGFEDYSSGNISKMKLASNYLSKGASLEKSSDAQFKSLVSNMEKELKENNHNTSITREIENYYTSFKNSKKSSLMSKGMSYLN